MKKLIREFFFLRKGERRALYVVLFLLTASAMYRVSGPNHPLPLFEPDEVFVQQVEEIRRQVDSVKRLEQEKKKYTSWSGSSGSQGKVQSQPEADEKVPLAPRPFDPNTISYESLCAMNLSEYVSRNIISYRTAGGIFREPADLARIYGLGKEDYEVLLPYVVLYSGDDSQSAGENLPDSANYSTYLEKRTGPWGDTLPPLELNRADSADLLALPGIGPWFAGRIIRYRKLLGGYVDPEQLMEVYGMDSARFSGIASLITVDSALVERIDLNTSSFQEIISHPYINMEETYAIFMYRDYMDTIPSAENILKDQIIDRDRFMRMAPYLSVKRQDD